MPPEYFLGLDLGQAADWSALAVLERTTMPQESTVRCEHAWQFGCRGLKRWPLGTSYPAIVDNVAALVPRPVSEATYQRQGEQSPAGRRRR